MFKLSLAVAVVFILVMYSLIGYSTSLGFGEWTKDNVLDTFSNCYYIWMDVISIVYAFALILAYPLML